MKLSFVFGMALVVFVVCRFLLAPLVLRRAQAKGGADTKKALVWLSVLGVLSLASLAATFATGTCILVLWILTAQHANTGDVLQRWLAAAHRWREMVDLAGTGWFVFLAMALIVGAAIYFRRKAQRRYDGAFDALVSHELDRLKEKADREGGLEVLPPTPNMLGIVEVLKQCDAELLRLSGLRNATAAIAEAEQYRQKAFNAYRSLDIERRLNLNLTPNDVALPEQSGFWGRCGTVLISTAWARQMTASTRSVAVIVLLVAIPGFIGLTQPLIQPQLDSCTRELTVQLEDLQFAANRDEASQDWEKVLAALPTAAEQKPLSDSDKQTMAVVAAYVEMRMFAPLYRDVKWKGGSKGGASGTARGKATGFGDEPGPSIVPEHYDGGARSRRVASAILDDHANTPDVSVKASGQPQRKAATNPAEKHLQFLADLNDHRSPGGPPGPDGPSAPGPDGHPGNPPPSKGPPSTGPPTPHPTSEFGIGVQKRLEAAASRDPGLLQRVKVSLPALQEQLRPGDLSRIVFEDIVSSQFGDHVSPLARKPDLGVG